MNVQHVTPGVLTEETPVCDSCGKEITDGWSYDVWLFNSRYDINNVCQKTGEQVEFVGTDYIVVGNCCEGLIRKAWTKFVKEVTK